MNVKKNLTNFAIDDMIQPAQRENNKLRSYLLVNTKQGKHVPVCPTEAINLFHKLGNITAEHYKGQKATIIGFAETATAIGAAVANCFGEDTIYIHTTREDIKHCKNLVNFEEEHSHATQQKLFSRMEEEVLKKAECVIFVEDEVTTGKTILNFVDVLKKSGFLSSSTKLVVASLVNNMTKDNLDKFMEYGIASYSLVQLEEAFEQMIFPMDKEEGQSYLHDIYESEDSMTEVSGRLDPRVGVLTKLYEKACYGLSQNVLKIVMQEIESIKNEKIEPKQVEFIDAHNQETDQINESMSILVLGTEEFMYPALLVGKLLSEEILGSTVNVHATTRSPIEPKNIAHYPLHNRVCLPSLYEESRVTYLYNLDQYDLVVILSDTELLDNKGYKALKKALEFYNNKHILGIRWIKE